MCESLAPGVLITVQITSVSILGREMYICVALAHLEQMVELHLNQAVYVLGSIGLYTACTVL